MGLSHRVQPVRLRALHPMTHAASPTPWQAPAEVNLVDLGFMQARSHLIELAAFLDRIHQANQAEDFRVQALLRALAQLTACSTAERTRQVLLTLSDPTTAAIPQAGTKGACGAYPG
jgi:hypothetical protein